jgi:hypothetical protein
MSDIIAWLVAVIGAAILICTYFIRLRTLRERRLQSAAEEFYKKVDILLDDADIPGEALDIIEYLNRQITNRYLGRRIFFSLLGRHLRVEPYSPNTKALQVTSSYYLNKRNDLLPIFMGACVTAIFAISYQSQMFGFLLRRLVFFDLNLHKDRGPDIVASLRASGIGDDVHCPAAA